MNRPPPRGPKVVGGDGPLWLYLLPFGLAVAFPFAVALVSWWIRR